MSTHLDLDDVAAGHPVAQKELDPLRAENLALALQVKALRDALQESRHALQFANDSPNGPINDTIWMMHNPETLFDYMDYALSTTNNSTAIIAAHDAEVRKDYFELREVATLAWRVLDECGPVISSIDPEDSGEQDGLDDLHKRLTEVAGSLFCVIRNPKISMAKAIDSPDADLEVTK